MKKIFFILFLAFIPLVAQESLPFSTLHIQAGIHQNSNEVLLHQFWEPESGFNLLGRTEFYLGNIEAGISKIDFKGKETIYPDFNSYYLFAGWNIDKEFENLFALSYGIRSGVFVMKFNDNEASEYESTESELAVSLNAQVEIPLYNRINLNLTSELLTIFTDKRIKLFTIGAGISYKLDTPNWLRKFFR